jgi:hypothetical protein
MGAFREPQKRFKTVEKMKAANADRQAFTALTGAADITVSPIRHIPGETKYLRRPVRCPLSTPHIGLGARFGVSRGR